MNANYIIGLIVIVTIIWVFISSRRAHLRNAHKSLEEKLTVKESWKQEKVMSYGQVQEIRQQLTQTVEERLRDDPEKKSLLKDIINEWAEMRIKTFTERRSWVRRPKKE